MKTTKKLAVLFLALILALSIMAVPAMAHEEDHVHTAACSETAIQPRMPGMVCPYCSVGMDVYQTEPVSGSSALRTRFICNNPDCPRSGYISGWVTWHL